MKNLLFVLFIFLVSFQSYAQENRVALVIGNSNYQNGAPLANPENDANDITEKLETSGFDVKCHIDLDQKRMKQVIDDFGSKLEGAEVGLFFYAGHGVQANGRNYLIPIDANLKTENDVEYNCVDAGRILAKMEDAGTNTNLIILDACRDNPFERSWSRNSKGNGLAHMDAPGGSLIAYSTSPGKTASDGYYRNSPYTAGLLEYISIPNLGIENLFKMVRIKVNTQTGGQQNPWEATSLTNDFYFNEDAGKTQPRLTDILPVNEDNSAIPVDYKTHRQALASGIRSIAVMPLSNYTGDESKDYIANGVHTALIGQLERLGPIKIISKTSTLPFADFKMSLKEIASELNVDGIVEASLLGLDDQLSLHVKLYSAFPEEELLWTEEYESNMSNLLNLYKDVTKNIADEIQLTLAPEKKEELEQRVLVDPEAYDFYLRGLTLLNDFSKESLVKGRTYISEAIEKDSTQAWLFTTMAGIWVTLANMGFETPEIAASEAKKNLNRAFNLNPDFVDYHFITASVKTSFERNWNEAERSFLRVLALNPNHALARIQYSFLLFSLQRSNEAMAQAQLAIELDPLNPMIRTMYCFALASTGDCRKALDEIEKVIGPYPYHYMANHVAAASAFNCGDFDRLFKLEINIHSIEGFDINGLEEIYQNQGFRTAYNEIIRRRELFAKTNIVVPVDMAWRYYVNNQDKKALDWIEKAYDMNDGNLSFVATEYMNFKRLYGNPRFQNIVKKLNLPMPDDY